MEVLKKVDVQTTQTMQEPQRAADELYELSLEEICEVFGGLMDSAAR